MSEHGGGGGGGAKWTDLLWLLGIFVAFFFIWVAGGGPERAQQNPPSPVLGVPAQN